MAELTLDEEMDISRVSLLYDKLKPLLAQAEPVTLNLSRITRIDGAGIQLLLSFVKSAHEIGIDVEIANPSSVCRNAISLLGVSEVFGFR